jgi:stage II sporulation protein AB (anti-sigma F factor)
MKSKEKTKLNYFKTVIPAKSVNEGFSRIISSAFLSQLDPTLEEICDIKTAVSEAVTNCTVHAYTNQPDDRKKLIYIS